MDSWKVVEARVDWLTCTASQEYGAMPLLARALDLIGDYVVHDNYRRSWYWQGYRGCQVDGLSAGYRIDGCCVRASGDRAGEHWRSLTDLSSNVSRLDIAITVQTDDSEVQMAVQLYESLANAPLRSGRPSELSIIRTSKGGETVYLGRRISPKFGRLYNKTIESGGDYPPTCWRYEVEYKAEAARSAAAALREMETGKEDYTSMVAAEFRRWGAKLLFPIPDVTMPSTAYRRPLTDTSKRLKWINETVAPSIERLSAYATEEELLRALGIWYTPIKPTAPGIERQAED